MGKYVLSNLAAGETPYANGANCDICSQSISTTDTIYHCITCKYDVCAKCYDKIIRQDMLCPYCVRNGYEHPELLVRVNREDLMALGKWSFGECRMCDTDLDPSPTCHYYVCLACSDVFCQKCQNDFVVCYYFFSPPQKRNCVGMMLLFVFCSCIGLLLLLLLQLLQGFVAEKPRDSVCDESL